MALGDDAWRASLDPFPPVRPGCGSAAGQGSCPLAPLLDNLPAPRWHAICSHANHPLTKHPNHFPSVVPHPSPQMSSASCVTSTSGGKPWRDVHGCACVAWGKGGGS